MLRDEADTALGNCFLGGVKELLPLAWRQAIGGAYADWKAQREKSRLLDALRGDAVECNVCGWRGARLTDDPWHAGTVCPVCGSQVRHRMFAALLDGCASLPGWDEPSFFAGKEVLHFAPERQLRERVRKTSKRHITADFERGDCDLRLDMSSMPSVAAASFDVVIACDVLEHVPDDRAAMRELRRILRDGGKALLTVPQKDPPADTDEDPSVVSEEERTRCFGQKDHVRMYGDDFAIRLGEAGFKVLTLDSTRFPEDIVRRNVLAPPVANPDPLATNIRRLYLAEAI
jgi:SAM-dependent methyltransferase